MNISPRILFVTNREDFACDYLIYKLLEKRTDYLRINSEDINIIDLKYKPHSTTINIEDKIYSLEDIRSVYFRRAPTIFPSTIKKEDNLFINRERKEFFEGIYLSLNAKWINPMFETYQAERKLFQLAVARKIGFEIPNTLVSNNPKVILDFLKSDERFIIKPIAHGLQVNSEGYFSIYTSSITSLDIIDSESLFESPVFIQKEIKNYRDIRVTVIKDTVFAVEIEKKDSTEVDWRAPDIEKNYREHQLPETLKRKIFILHSHLNLIYSAIDFILRPDGSYVFLEINPAGEWVWLERELKISISEALINELTDF